MLVALGDGEVITRRERRDVVLLVGQDELTITWSRYAPGERGPDLHVHREHTDAFYVLDGELTFGVGPLGEPVRMPAGGFVAVPPNVSHTFVNDSSADVRWLNLHAPDTGFAAYMYAARDGVQTSWDSFDPPADGGLPAAEAIVVGPGEGERAASGVRLKAVLPELCVAEWSVEPVVDARYVLTGDLAGPAHALTVQAPDAGFADVLRRGSD